jgi:hypothetical protein
MNEGYPVHYSVQYPERFSRLQLAIRILAFVALGMLGVSFGAAFLFAYFVLPIVAASRLASGRSAEAYVREDGAVILSVLRWFAALSAWAGLIAERLPERRPEEVVRLTVTGLPRLTPGAAASRVIAGVPSLLVLGLLAWIGAFVWLWAGASVLFTERVGRTPFGYLVGVQRWGLRLLAYQACLVEEYPPFSFVEGPSDTGLSAQLT